MLDIFHPAKAYSKQLFVSHYDIYVLKKKKKERKKFFLLIYLFCVSACVCVCVWAKLCKKICENSFVCFVFFSMMLPLKLKTQSLEFKCFTVHTRMEKRRKFLIFSHHFVCWKRIFAFRRAFFFLSFFFQLFSTCSPKKKLSNWIPAKIKFTHSFASVVE